MSVGKMQTDAFDPGRAGVLFRSLLSPVLAVLVGACSGAVTDGLPRADGRPEAASPVTFHAASTGLPISGIWKSTPALVDVNADGFLDLIALPRLGDGPRAWLGTADGRWVEASAGLEMNGSCGGGVVGADVNRDGHIDLVIADHCQGVFVFLGDGHGSWTAVVTEMSAAIARTHRLADDEDNPFLGAEDVAVGDVNEDGFADLVAAASNMGGFSVYLGDGSGTVWTEVTEPDGLPSGIDAEPDDTERAGWANRVLLADVDGDGHLDVVASFHSGPRVWRGNGAARWQPFSEGFPSPEAGGVYRALALGDVNSDGRTDLVTTNILGGVEVYLQTAQRTWQRTPSSALSTVAGGATAAALGDLDGDGHLDLVVGGRQKPGETHGVFVFLGDGAAEWRDVPAGLPRRGYPFIWGITVADVNKDRAPDVVVATGVVVNPYPVRGAARRGPNPLTERVPFTNAQLEAWVNTRYPR